MSKFFQDQENESENELKFDIQQANQNKNDDEINSESNIINRISNQSKDIINLNTQMQGKSNKRKRKQNQQMNDQIIQQTQQETIKDQGKKTRKLKVAAQLALDMLEQKRIMQQEQRKLELIQYEEEEQLKKEEQIRIEKLQQQRNQSICYYCQERCKNLRQKKNQLQTDIKKKELLQKLMQQQQQQQQEIIINHKNNNNNYQQTDFYTCSILGDFEAGKTTIIKGLIKFMKKFGFQIDNFGYSYVCQPSQNFENLFVQMQSFFPVNYENQKFIFYDRPLEYKNLLTYTNCDIAILVIDIMQGLDSQSIKDIEYLKLRSIPFIIVFNKFDRCFMEKNTHQLSYQQLQDQTQNCKIIFSDRLNYLLQQLSKMDLKATQYWEQAESKNYISVVPTSGTFGIGYEDLLATLVKYLQNHQIHKFHSQYLVLSNKLYEKNKSIIECLIINGHLKKGDSLLIPVDGHPTSLKIQKLYEIYKEMKIKQFDKNWVEIDEIDTKQGFVRIITQNLQSILQGFQLKIANSDEAVQEAQQFIENQFFYSMSNIELNKEGIGVIAQDQASLLKIVTFTKQNKIQISFANFGRVCKNQILKFIQIQKEQKINLKYACIFAFGIQIQQDIIDIAQQNEIQIISDEDCYSLIDKYQKYIQVLIQNQKKQIKDQTIFPCLLNIKELIQLSKPMILKVEVVQGILIIGTPLSYYDKKQVNVNQLGIVKRIEYIQQDFTEARVLSGLIIIIIEENSDMDQFQFQYVDKPQLVSKISRQEINILKEYYREELSLEDWQLVVELKKYFSII